MKWYYIVLISTSAIYTWRLAWKAGMKTGTRWSIKSLYWFMRYKGCTSAEAKKFINELGLFFTDEQEFIKQQLYERDLNDPGTDVEPDNVQKVV